MWVTSLYKNTSVICEDMSLFTKRFLTGVSTVLRVVNTSIEAAHHTRIGRHTAGIELMKRLK